MIGFREGNNGKTAAEILQRQYRHGVALFGVFDIAGRYNSCNAHYLPVCNLGFSHKLVQWHKALQHPFIFAKRMIGNIKADDFLFVLQNYLLRKFLKLRQADFRHAKALVVTKQAYLPVGAVTLAGSTQIAGLVQNRQQLRALGTKGIHSTAFDEVFYDALIDDAHIDAAAKICQALKSAPLAAGCYNGIHSGIACALDACKAKADGIILVYGKIVAAFVDIRRQNINAVIFADGDIPAYLVTVADNAV